MAFANYYSKVNCKNLCLANGITMHTILKNKGEHWVVFDFLDSFSFGKSVRIIKTQTQNYSKIYYAVSVLVWRFLAVNQKEKYVIDFELYLKRKIVA